MTDKKVYFYESTPWSAKPGSSATGSSSTVSTESRSPVSSAPRPTVPNKAETLPRIESSTCTEAETFVLRVLDESMQPEFRQGCVIVIDPTGHATDGSFVLARRVPHDATNDDNTDDIERLMEEFVFRQLQRGADNQWQLAALNNDFPSETTASDFSEIVGVIVQRAGTRRRYHKFYE